MLNLRRNDLHTAIQSTDTMSIPQEREREGGGGGGEWGHLTAKSKPSKNYKIQYK